MVVENEESIRWGRHDLKAKVHNVNQVIKSAKEDEKFRNKNGSFFLLTSILKLKRL